MFNTPVLFLIFNRPEATAKVFAEIRKQKPKYLYIGADGPRAAVPEDAELCKKCREIAMAVPAVIFSLFARAFYFNIEMKTALCISLALILAYSIFKF